MRFSHFFIDRPIFAAVIAVAITVIGGLAYFGLPVSQYPNIVPPTVNVTAQYPGATAETVAETVAAPLEQQINGIEGMLYQSSQSTGDGKLTITVTFKVGTDLNAAQVLVQNRVAAALPRLPPETPLTAKRWLEKLLGPSATVASSSSLAKTTAVQYAARMPPPSVATFVQSVVEFVLKKASS